MLVSPLHLGKIEQHTLFCYGREFELTFMGHISGSTALRVVPVLFPPVLSMGCWDEVNFKPYKRRYKFALMVRRRRCRSRWRRENVWRRTARPRERKRRVGGGAELDRRTKPNWLTWVGKGPANERSIGISLGDAVTLSAPSRTFAMSLSWIREWEETRSSIPIIFSSFPSIPWRWRRDAVAAGAAPL